MVCVGGEPQPVEALRNGSHAAALSPGQHLALRPDTFSAPHRDKSVIVSCKMLLPLESQRSARIRSDVQYPKISTEFSTDYICVCSITWPLNFSALLCQQQGNVGCGSFSFSSLCEWKLGAGYILREEGGLGGKREKRKLQFLEMNNSQSNGRAAE